MEANYALPLLPQLGTASGVVCGLPRQCRQQLGDAPGYLHDGCVRSGGRMFGAFGVLLHLTRQRKACRTAGIGLIQQSTTWCAWPAQQAVIWPRSG